MTPWVRCPARIRMTRSATSSSLWSTRLALYEVSPTFAKLQDVLETPEMYNGYGDPETGELNSGGIHWVLRKAAWTGRLLRHSPGRRKLLARGGRRDKRRL